MKTITKFILPRYVWFRLWFNQWFKNPDGIKGFADLAMNELVQRCMRIFKRVNRTIANLQKQLTATTASIDRFAQSVMVSQDDVVEVRNTARLYFWLNWAFVGAETVLNSISLIGWLRPEREQWYFFAFIIAVAFAVSCTGMVAFKQLVQAAMPKPKYGRMEAERGDKRWAILWTVVFLIIEVLLVMFGWSRGTVLDQTADPLFTMVMAGLSMIFPVICGLLVYKRSLILDALSNYYTMVALQHRLNKILNRLADQEALRQSVFKQIAQDKWSILQEFKIYKNNFDLRKGHSELLVGHFSEAHDSFMREASFRLESKELEAKPPSVTSTLYLPSRGT